MLEDMDGEPHYAGGAVGRFAGDDGLYDIERTGIGQLIAAVYNQAVYIRGTEPQALDGLT